MRWLGAAMMLSACAGDLGEPRFAADSCRAVELVDAETGKTVVGAEDLVLSDRHPSFWVSAYDRLANTTGGLYQVPLEQLSQDRVDVVPLVSGVRPHGILSGDEDSVTAIVRDADGSAALQMFLRVPRPDSEVLEGPKYELPCGANDAARTGSEISTYTVDPQFCSGSIWSRLLGKPEGRVEQLVGVARDQRTALQGLTLPNGVVRHQQDVWVAEMRAQRLINFDRKTIDLPGAPDNLNPSSQGIVAALQPSLWRFGLYRYGYWHRAPTRIVLIDPATEDIEVLYDDPKGQLVSGATAAMLTDEGTMVASSVRGDRLLVCEPQDV